jgi:transcriptional regulator with XRE-family HTH domain
MPNQEESIRKMVDLDRARRDAATGLLRRRRQRLGMSLRDMAKLVGTTASTGSRLEDGVAITRDATLFKWVETLRELETRRALGAGAISQGGEL